MNIQVSLDDFDTDGCSAFLPNPNTELLYLPKKCGEPALLVAQPWGLQELCGKHLPYEIIDGLKERILGEE